MFCFALTDYISCLNMVSFVCDNYTLLAVSSPLFLVVLYNYFFFFLEEYIIV
jgi:hypothetical protein